LISSGWIESPQYGSSEHVAPTDAAGQAEAQVARERRRLARQLHDEIASVMFAAKLELDVASCLASRGAPMEQVLKALDDATRASNAAMAAMREICAELGEIGPENWDMFGELTGWLQALERRIGARCLLSIRCGCSGFDTAAATRIRSIVREKLSEIARHPGVRKVRVDIRGSQRQCELKIQLQTIQEPAMPMVKDAITRQAGGWKHIEDRFGAATAPASVTRKSTFLVKMPRGTGHKVERSPDPEPRMIENGA
jgi:hypothetical protein